MESSYHHHFDIIFFRRVWSIHKIIFINFLSYNNFYFCLLLLLSALEQFLVYKVGLLSGEFIFVLESKNPLNFRPLLLYSSALLSSIVIVLSTRIYVTKLLIVCWRQILGEKWTSVYFRNSSFYRIIWTKNIDNPDQRITVDIKTFCTTYGSIIADLIVVPPSIFYYIYDTFTRTGVLGPCTLILYFLINTGVNKCLMSPLVQIKVQEEKLEGDYRFKLMSIRDNAESIAFIGSSSVENYKSHQALKRVLNLQKQYCRREFFLNLSLKFFDYFGSIASYCLTSIPVFYGTYDSLNKDRLAQKISENAFVCIMLVYKLSTLANMATVVIGMAGVTHRIAEMNEKLGNENVTSHVSNVSFYLSINNITLKPPKSNLTLIRELSLFLERPANILITGPSSSGKTSLLRALCGLWKISFGSIQICNDIFFVPQRPFLTSGTLREQIMYPTLVTKSELNSENDTWMYNAISELDLTELFLRCGEKLDVIPDWSSWSDVLSGGEMQKLAFLRLFFHMPFIAALDEATSSLSEEMEAKLYHLCHEKGINLISVGHRESLKQFHSVFLTLGTDTNVGWTLS